LHELSTWDFERLAVELGDLKAMDVNLELLGFGEDELAKLLDPGVKDGLCDPDDVPEPPGEAITQSGDLWVMGDHRLLCGDSSKTEDVDRLLDGVVAHLINTDPPYNVKVEPRSNNAIAAGLSSFGEHGLMHHQSFDLHRAEKKRDAKRTASKYHGFDVATGGQSGKATHKKLRPKDRPMADAYVRVMLKRLAARAGIDKRVHAHGLRHTHAAQLRAEGVDIAIISRQLGHSSITTTARYLDYLAPRAVIETMRNRHWAEA